METKYPFHKVKHEVKTIQELLDWSGYTYASNDAYRFFEGNTICTKTYKELLQDVQFAGRYLKENFASASHIAVIGPTSYQWIVAWLSIVTTGLVAVPLDRLLQSDEILKLLRQADVSTLIFDNEQHLVAEAVHDACPEITCICMTEPFYGQDSFVAQLLIQRKLGEPLWSESVDSDTIAEIVFTSGTTGNYKGCVLTHKNLAWNAMNGSTYAALTPKDKTMSILPIHHTLEVTAGMLTPFCSGVTVCINDSLRHIQRNLNIFHPECMIAVPMVVEMLNKNIWITAKKTKQEQKLQFALKLSKCLQKLHIHIERQLFASVLDKLGGNLRLLVVGGAYLEPKLVENFSAMGITIVQGYGVTECGPVVACNTDRKWKADSVGQTVTGCKIKIVDGEIWVSGPIVMQGYYNDPQANRDAFEGEWYKTGDLGYMDKNGYLYLTGRKKNLIILSNGENVSPEELEQKLTEIPGICEVIVCAEKNTLTAEIYSEPGADINVIEQQIEGVNKTLPEYKNIRKVIFRDTPFPKTTTQKIKRNYSNIS